MAIPARHIALSRPDTMRRIHVIAVVSSCQHRKAIITVATACHVSGNVAGATAAVRRIRAGGHTRRQVWSGHGRLTPPAREIAHPVRKRVNYRALLQDRVARVQALCGVGLNDGLASSWLELVYNQFIVAGWTAAKTASKVTVPSPDSTARKVASAR